MSTDFPADLNALHRFLANSLKLQPHDHVLDAGCGRGISLGPLLEGCPNGRVSGLDVSEAAIDHARDLFSDRVELQVTDIEGGLPYKDAQFDKVLSHNVIECLADKPAFINEIHRVLKPGGVMLLSHNDFDSQIYNTRQLELTRHLVHLFADTKQKWMAHADGVMGRKLYGLVGQSPFGNCEPLTYTLVNTEFSPGNYGYDRAKDIASIGGQSAISEDELKAWFEDLQSLHDSGEYFYSVNTYAIRAEK